MTVLAIRSAHPFNAVPALIAAAGDAAGMRFLDFFASTIRNAHTRRAYGRAVTDFLDWCAKHGVLSISAVQPLHVAAWVELQTREHAAPTAKQRLAAIRHLFDWLVTSQVVPTNPATSVRGPAYSMRKGKTPVLDPSEARILLDTIETDTPIGLRDRALIGVMVYSFARIGAALAMNVEDAFVRRRRLWVRLHEKGGKLHEMPCHHSLEEYLHSYIAGTGIAADSKGALFRTIGRGTGRLTSTPPAASERLCHGAPARAGRRHRHPHRQPQFSGDGHYRLHEKRRHPRKRGRHGQSCQHPHDAALRSPAG